MNVFEAVKQSVTTRQAAERYGIKVNRNGMCVCPFHNDKNPSMKVDRRFYCFGCGATGDVIDFVSRLHGIGSKEAALMLAQDFSIPYEDGRNARKQPIRPRLRRETEEQKFKRMEGKRRNRNLSAWSGTASGYCPTITISCAAGRKNTPPNSQMKHGIPGL